MVDTSSSSDQQSRDKIVKPSTLFQQQQESGLQRKGRRFIVANRDDFLRIQFKRISSGEEKSATVVEASSLLLDDVTGGLTRTKSSPNFEKDTSHKNNSKKKQDHKPIEPSSNSDRNYSTLIRTSSTIIPKPISEKLDLPSCIFSNSVYLGDCFQATNRKSIDYLNITHIVNCTKNIENKFEKNHIHHSHHGEKIIHSQNSDPIENSLEDQCIMKNDLEEEAMIEKYKFDHNNESHTQTGREIKYMRVAIDDDKNAPISHYFQECYEFIEDAISNSGVVLVHCAAGVSRSSTIIISYVMKKMGVGCLFAFQLVKKRRRMIMPNEGFFHQLMEYEKKLNGGRTVSVLQNGYLDLLKIEKEMFGN
nr:unnamed protein product [Naegleria fowleri]